MKSVNMKKKWRAPDCGRVHHKNGHNEQQSFVDESMRYIQKHFKERLTLQMVASRVYMNAQYFSRGIQTRDRRDIYGICQ